MSKSPVSPDDKPSQNPVDDSEEKLSAEESKGKNKTQFYFTFCGKASQFNSTFFTFTRDRSCDLHLFYFRLA